MQLRNSRSEGDKGSDQVRDLPSPRAYPYTLCHNGQPSVVPASSGSGWVAIETTSRSTPSTGHDDLGMQKKAEESVLSSEMSGNT